MTVFRCAAVSFVLVAMAGFCLSVGASPSIPASSPPTGGDCAELEARIASLVSENHQLKEEVRTLQERVEILEFDIESCTEFVLLITDLWMQAQDELFWCQQDFEECCN